MSVQLFKIVTLITFCSILSFCSKKVGLKRWDIGLKTNSYWFEEEETLFVFYTATSDRPFPNEYVLELQDLDGADSWRDIADIETVHQHRQAKCPINSLCGSYSIKAKNQPPVVNMRYRFHREGMESDNFAFYPHLVFKDINKSLARSYLVYGVFDEDNRKVQWRGVHNFPDLSQNEVDRFGLRREFSSNGLYYGRSATIQDKENVTLYGKMSDCFEFAQTLDENLSSNSGQPFWSKVALPNEAQDFPIVCTTAEVKDGKGSFKTTAFARKNPQVSPVLPKLNINIAEAVRLPIVIGSCYREYIDKEFLEFQLERLKLPNQDIEICYDSPEGYWAEVIEQYISQKILDNFGGKEESVLLNIIVNHTFEDYDKKIYEPLERALVNLYLAEKKVIGSFVYDSIVREKLPKELIKNTLWCPINAVGSTNVPESCVVKNVKSKIGPFKLSFSPLLPSRKAFHSLSPKERNGTSITGLKVLHPKRMHDLLMFEYGDNDSAFFHAADIVKAGSSQGFSYCHLEDHIDAFAFKEIRNPYRTHYYSEFERSWGLPNLAKLHHKYREDRSYYLGLAWQAPFQIQIFYKSTVQAEAGLITGTLPFAKDLRSRDDFGDVLWDNRDFNLGNALLKCHRFCDNPAFDDSGKYVIQKSWNELYSNFCYRPKIPRVGG